MCLFGYGMSLCIVATTKLRVICFYCHIAAHVHCASMLTTPVTKVFNVCVAKIETFSSPFGYCF